ncbi:MAG: S41 family peptidase [Clostridia bacterium]|nr:S41 family peptidase [Clostridia bacterium]
MKKKVLIIAMLLALMAGVIVVSANASSPLDYFGGRNQKTVTISQEEYDRLSRYKKMDTIMQYIEQWYIEEPDTDKMIENATRGILYALEDPYTFYYNEEEWDRMKEEDEGKYGGIGIQMLGNAEDYSVTITRVFKDTPAQRAGVLKGDVLVRVEDLEVDFYSMQNAVNIMRGTVETPVEIEVKRGEEYITFHIPRAMIHVNRVEHTMLEDNVGLIILYEFAGESEQEFSAALEELKNQGAKALIVDLRDNGGGWVDSASHIADLFLDDGLLFYSEDRYGNREESKMKEGKDDIPLVILINGQSASSAEILSGGLHDRGRATLVGTQSYGKGIMQVVIPLDDDLEGFQMTYQQYFLPSGVKVHKVGLTPDIISEMPEELANAYFELGDLSDPQLKDAWETARSLINTEI